jgi:hypothetical protein
MRFPLPTSAFVASGSVRVLSYVLLGNIFVNALVVPIRQDDGLQVRNMHVASVSVPAAAYLARSAKEEVQDIAARGKGKRTPKLKKTPKPTTLTGKRQRPSPSRSRRRIPPKSQTPIRELKPKASKEPKLEDWQKRRGGPGVQDAQRHRPILVWHSKQSPHL